MRSKGVFSRWMEQMRVKVDVCLEVVNPTREEYLYSRFLEKVRRRSVVGVAKKIELGVRLIDMSELMFVRASEHPGIPLVYSREEAGYYLVFRVTRTEGWEYRNLYWRFRTILESYGYRYWDERRVDWFFCIKKKVYYRCDENEKERYLVVMVNPERGGMLGEEWLREGLGIGGGDELLVKFASEKRWWEWY